MEQNSSKKRAIRVISQELDISKTLIPTYILKDRTLSVFEALVEFLKEKEHMTYSKIGKITNRDQRNIWTVYSRACKKRNIEICK